ncbi:MAG: NUDIX hydrolase [Planctomycetaceae bacterium]|jgi:ADP-ribose pyrophosphatase|nr:NUDIX hydrolase [Planctomycetaceae bacterium]
MEDIFTSRIFKVVRKFVVGRSGAKLARDVIVHPGAVVILPLLDDGQVVLLRQFRVSVEERLIELPAGTLEPPELPYETARRELLEETGYTAGSLVEASHFYSSPGILRETMHLFVAKDLIAGPTNLEDGEDIEVFTVPLEKAVDMVYSGEIKDSKTIIGVLWYWNSLRNKT